MASDGIGVGVGLVFVFLLVKWQSFLFIHPWSQGTAHASWVEFASASDLDSAKGRGRGQRTLGA